MDWLNFHHLRYFWTVAKEGSLARAAARLRVSQPSISGQIRELEEALGERLFRRSGRNNVLTDAGRMVFNYADEIFALGRELVNSVQQHPTAKTMRFFVGVADSFPKSVTNDILKPVFSLSQSVHVVCREGKIEDLLAQLVAHRLDLVLTDEAPSSSSFKTFDHPLGDSGTGFFADGALAGPLRRHFPKSLDGAPAFLPAENTTLRRAVEAWFREQGIRPRVVAEFDDLALMKVMAAEGRGFIAVPLIAEKEALERHAFKKVGEAPTCRVRFHAITAERRIHHPAANAITANDRQLRG